MATFTKALLSGSVNGKGIKIAATGSPGDTIHTAVAGTASFDEIWLYVTNNHTADVTFTLQWGGTTAVDHDVVYTVPYKDGLKIQIPGFLLQNGLVVKGYASITNVLVVYGFVHQIA
jgi:hypothetical protein